jgi:hypothetical protein
MADGLTKDGTHEILTRFVEKVCGLLSARLKLALGSVVPISAFCFPNFRF